MCKSFGSSLVDYIVPTAVVGLVVGLALYGLNANGILKKFISASANYEVEKQSATANSFPSGSTGINKLAGGSLGGTPENPVEQCSFNKCNIDFGDFILTGIPENFQDYNEISGNSGGTEVMFALLEQIADQLEADGDIAGAAQYRMLSNMGHLLAEAQKTVEATASKYENDGYAGLLLFNSEIENINLTIPPDLASKIQGNNGSISVKDIAITQNGRIDLASNIRITDPAKFNTKKDTMLNYAVIDAFNSIMENPNYSNSMKGVTQELFRYIDDISFDLSAQFNTPYTPTTASINKYDPVSGGLVGSVTSPTGTLDAVGNSFFSTSTDVNSALICATGWNIDTGSKCHKP
ncbi:MAG: hypothetical protein AB1782_09015 [Cyanobacteriota bacterium]